MPRVTLSQASEDQLKPDHPVRSALKWVIITIGAIGLVLTLLIVLFVYILGGAGASNQAADDFAPIAKQLLPINARFICDRSDSGHGLDNTIPWYSAYYSMPSGSDLNNKLDSVLTSSGFGPSGQLTSQPDADQQKTSYTKGDSKLEITVVRSGGLSLDCGVEDYGKMRNVEAGEALVLFYLTEKDTQAQ